MKNDLNVIVKSCTLCNDHTLTGHFNRNTLYICNHQIAVLCINSYRKCSRQSKVWGEKSDLGQSESGMVVGAGLSMFLMHRSPKSENDAKHLSIR